MRRVAVVGSGISGLSVAWGLRDQARVTLYEAGDHFGGHANTVDVTLAGRDGLATHGVDTGFLVYNECTYPKLIALFGELGVATAASDMSFSVQVPATGFEWSGTSLNSVFTQRRNLMRPSFLRMLAQIARFNRVATSLAERGDESALAEPLGEFLIRHDFSRAFRDWYFLPMVSCIWSCPAEQMLRFPVATMIRFCHNHGLLQVTDRPQWRTVVGGAREYVAKMIANIADARRATPVRSVRRNAGDAGVWVATDHGQERYDDVVMACHSDQSLALLTDATPTECEVLGAIRYHPNRAVLHTDTSLLPRRRLAWAAWNYERATGDAKELDAVCLHYWLNRLQPLPWDTPVVVSLNPVREPRGDTVLADIGYAHPVFDQAAIDAQRRLGEIQGRAHTWFCGAWTRYGFHEDGLLSGLAVVDALRVAHASAMQEAA